MDRPAVAAAEAFVHAGYPLDCEALLIVELDGCDAEVDHLIAEVEAIADRHGATSGERAGERSACSFGPDARPPFRPSAEYRPTITAWTGRSRAERSAASFTK